jgi:hypothetical protein
LSNPNIGFSEAAVLEYVKLVQSLPLFGTTDRRQSLLPHITAYILGSINLLALAGFDFRETIYASKKFRLEHCVNPKTHLPYWPLKWSHHTWRVSHWIGGIPSILLNVAKNSRYSEWDESYVRLILESCDEKLLDHKTGLLKAYQNDSLQFLFRYLYRIRHNPEHGDIGGLVHLHWINYVVGREYKAGKELLKRCLEHLKPSTFLEKTPYCLDFDYLQLIRTILEQNPSERTLEISERMKQYEQSVFEFIREIPRTGYGLHKLPGALATWHEARLSHIHLIPIQYQPIDIIKCAYWL